MTKFHLRFAQPLVIAFSLILGVASCSQSADDSNETNDSANPVTIMNGFEDSEKSVNSSNASIVASAFSTTSEKWVESRILVKPKEGVDDQQIESILSSHGGKVVGKITAINVQIVELPQNANEKAIAALLTHNPKFLFAEVDVIVTATQIPNDPYYAPAYHLPIIKAPTAWDTAKGDGVTIAILDTGVLGTHIDLASKMVPGYNFVDNNTDTSDIYGHGTPVAGAAAAIGNNGASVAGIRMATLR